MNQIMIREQGWRSGNVPIERLTDLQEAIEERYKQGLIDEFLYLNQFKSFSFEIPEDLPGARSIMIVAVPAPQVRITFTWQGKPVPLVLPPTYVSYTPRAEWVQTVIESWLKPQGYKLAKTKLPLKALAVCSGLAEYGRNNICYVPGMGSFLQLVGAFSDLPCGHDFWREPKAMDRCSSCIACLNKCPTGAIGSDRFLIHAEICLTYHNEASEDFPTWINPDWHHCLIGCMQCQTICPENRHVRDWFEDRVLFTEEETRLLVRRVPFNSLSHEAAARLDSLELSEAYNALCRNQSMIIGRQ